MFELRRMQGESIIRLIRFQTVTLSFVQLKKQIVLSIVFYRPMTISIIWE